MPCLKRGFVIAAAALVSSTLSAPPAQASYIVTLAQQGNNVVATGSGTLDTFGLSFQGGVFGSGALDPHIGFISTGPPGLGTVDVYTGFTGPTSFGSGGVIFPSSGSGGIVGIDGTFNSLDLPSGYVSGTALSDSATYANKTLSSLGVTPGTYVWTWGSGAHADSFTLDIVAPALQQGYIVTLTQQGNDVVATGSGALDTSGLSFQGGVFGSGALDPHIGFISTGPPGLGTVDVYTGSAGFIGPTSFGGGGVIFPSSGSGGIVGIDGTFKDLDLPSGYVSGTALSDSATYANKTLSSLGVTPGTYVWRWGSDVNQIYTLNIVAPAAVPEPSSLMLLVLSLGLVILLAARQRRAPRIASFGLPECPPEQRGDPRPLQRSDCRRNRSKTGI